MIFDTLDRASLYTGLGECMDAAFEYLRTADLNALETGRVDLSDDLYVMVQRFTTRAPETGVWEAHRKYIDIHYLVSGKERIGFANLGYMQDGKEDPEKDMYYPTGSGHDLVLHPGCFAVFYPQDAHAPGLAADQSEPIYKVVMKVRV